MKFLPKLLTLSAIVLLGAGAATAEEGTTGNNILNKITNKTKEAAANIQPSAGNVDAPFGDGSFKAKPGECYGKVTIPAVTKTETRKVEISPATKEIAKIIPATYKTVSEEFVSKEASEKLVTIPATYKTVTEEVIVKPASKKIVKVPAKYKTTEERVLVSAARTEWKKGNSSPITRTNAQGDVMCLVEIPAEYKTIKKRVLAEAEKTTEQIIPAVTKKITRRVVDQPARVEKKAIPAVKSKISKKVLDTPEKIVYKETPAKFRTVTNEVVVSPSQSKWDKILCQTNASTTNVTALQRALEGKGFEVGPIDGVLGYQTYQAVDRFQRKKGLNRGEITYETLSALGLKF